MKLHELTPALNSKTKAKRVGRGQGSGLGRISGRGSKGQHARNTVRPGFEGGQTTLARRLPKRGFNNIFKKQYAIVNIKDLNCFEAGSTIDEEVLFGTRLIGKKMPYGVKVLGNGELNVKNLTVKAACFTESAKQKIEKAGGKAEVI